MSHDDDYDQERYRTRGEQIRERNDREPREAERRGPYQGQRDVRTFGEDDRYAAEHPWRAAHPRDEGGRPRSPRRSEQPARYGGGYDDDELWSTSRGDARHGPDTRGERPFVEGHQNEDNRHRAHGYGTGQQAWRGQRAYGRGHPGQNNSGYDREREYGQGSERDDARSDVARASWTQEHDYQGPPYRREGRASGYGSQQYGHTDIYGGAGFRQEGKRYWFDESDQRAGFRGTSPRGYQRSDERLRELACERLTEADLDASDIEVKVSHGVVTLEGSVRARWMKHQAEDLVDDIGGVKDIQNQLRVASGPGSSASTTTTGVQPSGQAITASSPSTSATGGGTGGGGSGPLGGGDIGGRSKH